MHLVETLTFEARLVVFWVVGVLVSVVLAVVEAEVEATRDGGAAVVAKMHY